MNTEETLLNYRKSQRKDDWQLLLFASVLAVLGGFAVCSAGTTSQPTVHSLGVLFGGAVALVVDVYLVLVLRAAAERADDKYWCEDLHKLTQYLFPTRHGGLPFVTLLMAAMTFGFAALYVGDDVFATSKTRGEALYISLSTLGLNDFSPSPGYGQVVVGAHLVSAILMITGVFALLISRLSTFAECPHPLDERPHFVAVTSQPGWEQIQAAEVMLRKAQEQAVQLSQSIEELRNKLPKQPAP